MENYDNTDKSENESGIKSSASNEKTPDVGAGPVNSDLINDGGHGEAKQRKEHTGNATEMGGGTGGTPGLEDASEGNSN